MNKFSLESIKHSSKSLRKQKLVDGGLPELVYTEDKKVLQKQIIKYLKKLNKFLFEDYDKIVLSIQDEWEKANAIDLPEYSSGESLYMETSTGNLTDIDFEIQKAKLEIECGRFIMGQARLMKILPSSLKPRFMLGLCLINDEIVENQSKGYVLMLAGLSQSMVYDQLDNKELLMISESLEKIKQYAFTVKHLKLTDSFIIITNYLTSIN